MGTLTTQPAVDRPDLLAPPVTRALAGWTGTVPVRGVEVAEIDPDLADTAAFCERYGVALDVSANCVVLAARRGGETTLAAAVVLATTRADVNGLVRRHLDARKCSFAAVDVAVEATGMEYGGITPIGLPADWPVLVDSAVVEAPSVVIGSGVRRSKLVLPGAALAELPMVVVIPNLGIRNQPPDTAP
jgi:prolyl-tRNA editing enzyme YbaK/EbsC (Cys-tRNA(Pro) deacylase)